MDLTDLVDLCFSGWVLIWLVFVSIVESVFFAYLTLRISNHVAIGKQNTEISNSLLKSIIVGLAMQISPVLTDIHLTDADVA